MSINRMDNAVMVPADKRDEIRDQLEALGITSIRSILDIARRVSVLDPTESELAAMRLLKKHNAKSNPFLWYLKAADTFVDTLTSEGKVTGRVLVAVNDRNLKLLSDLYPHLTRISTLSHGLNKYLGSNTLIFTAALNPEPEMSILYKALLPNYDYVRDHLADSCTQAVTRLCVRDVESEVIAYVILPDLATAELLRSKMLSRPVISTRAISGSGMLALTTLNVKRKETTEAKVLRQSGGNKHERWRSNELNKKLVSKRASRSRLRRQLKEDTENRSLLTKIAKLDSEIAALLKLKGTT